MNSLKVAPMLLCLLCLLAAVLPGCAELVITKAAVDKVFYDPGDTMHIAVEVKNTAA